MIKPLPVTVDDDDTPTLRGLVQSLYEEGVQFIKVDFSMTNLLSKPCLGVLML